jgi:hypothetical protein
VCDTGAVTGFGVLGGYGYGLLGRLGVALDVAMIDVPDHTLAGYDAARLTRTAVVPADDGPTHHIDPGA